MQNITGTIIVAALLAFGSACATDQEDGDAWTAEQDEVGETKVLLEDGLEKADGDVSTDVTLSFFRSCSNPFASGVGSAATYAEASSCRRRNGTWTGFRSWSGFCTRDVANIDGNLRCQ